MYVFGLVRSGQRGKSKEIGGRVGVRLVVLIRPAVSFLSSHFLLVPFKTNKLCTGKNLII